MTIRHFYLLMLIAVFFIACDNQNPTSETTSDSTASSTNTTSEQSAETRKVSIAESDDPGAKLIAESDCRNCHKEYDKVIGPAFNEVAKKYTSKDIDFLAGKIIKGGDGSWGTVPMTPHPNLSEADAKAMASFILTVK